MSSEELTNKLSVLLPNLSLLKVNEKRRELGSNVVPNWMIMYMIYIYVIHLLIKINILIILIN